MRDGPGGGAKIRVEGGLAETGGFSPSRHPGSIDVDTGREGLPDTAGILRATEEAVGLQEKERRGRKTTLRRKMRQMRDGVQISGRSVRKRGLLSDRARHPM